MKSKWQLSLFFIVILIMSCSAHSGKTDANGGHWDHSIGEYHYHHGYPAHQHIDGTCPYDFDDQTNHNDSNSASTTQSNRQNSEKSIKKYVQENEPDTNKKSKAASKNYDWIPISIFAFFGVLFIIGTIISIYEKHKYNKEKKYYTELYAGKSVDELVDIPDDVEIGADDLPREKSAVESWGVQYTFYASKTGTRYHVMHGCSGATHEIHAYSCMQSKIACVKCHPHLPDMSWYEEYLKIKNIKLKYGITDEHPTECINQLSDDNSDTSKQLTADEHISVNTLNPSEDVKYKSIF